MESTRRKRLSTNLTEESAVLRQPHSMQDGDYQHLAYNALIIAQQHLVCPNLNNPRHEAKFRSLLDKAEHIKEEFVNLDINYQLNGIPNVEHSAFMRVEQLLTKLQSRCEREHLLDKIFQLPITDMCVDVRSVINGILEVDPIELFVATVSTENQHSQYNIASTERILQLKEHLQRINTTFWQPILMLLQYQSILWYLSLQEKVDQVNLILLEVFKKQQEKYSISIINSIDNSISVQVKMSILIEQLHVFYQPWMIDWMKCLHDAINQHLLMVCDFIEISRNILFDTWLSKLDQFHLVSASLQRSNILEVRSWVCDTLRHALLSSLTNISRASCRLYKSAPLLQQILSCYLMELQTMIGEYDREIFYHDVIGHSNSHNYSNTSPNSKHPCNNWRKRFKLEYSKESKSIFNSAKLQSIGLVSDMLQIVYNLSESYPTPLQTYGLPCNSLYFYGDQLTKSIIYIANLHSIVCSYELHESYQLLGMIAKFQSSLRSNLHDNDRHHELLNQDNLNRLIAYTYESMHLRKSLINDPYNGCVYHRGELLYVNQRELCRLLDAYVYLLGDYASVTINMTVTCKDNRKIWLKEQIHSFYNAIEMKRKHITYVMTKCMESNSINILSPADYLCHPLDVFQLYLCHTKYSTRHTSSLLLQQLTMKLEDGITVVHRLMYNLIREYGMIYTTNGICSVFTPKHNNGHIDPWLHTPDIIGYCAKVIRDMKEAVIAIESVGGLTTTTSPSSHRRGNSEIAAVKNLHCCEIFLWCARLTFLLVHRFHGRLVLIQQSKKKKGESIVKSDFDACMSELRDIYYGTVCTVSSIAQRLASTSRVKATDEQDLDRSVLRLLLTLLSDALKLKPWESIDVRDKQENDHSSSTIDSACDNSESIPEYWKSSPPFLKSSEIYKCFQSTYNRVSKFVKVLLLSKRNIDGGWKSKAKGASSNDAFLDLLDGLLPWFFLELRSALLIVDMHRACHGDCQVELQPSNNTRDKPKCREGCVDDMALNCYEKVYELLDE